MVFVVLINALIFVAIAQNRNNLLTEWNRFQLLVWRHHQSRDLLLPIAIYGLKFPVPLLQR